MRPDPTPALRVLRAIGLRTLLLGTMTAGAGCGGRMMPTPLIYRDPGPDPFILVPPEERTTHTEVLFAVDREPSGSAYPATAYSDRRGGSLRLGRATVRIGSDWDAFVERIRIDARPGLRVTGIEEFGKLWTTVPMLDEDFPAAQASIASGNDADAVRAPARRFAAEVNDRLERTRRRDVVVYVPGFNTTFETPLYRVAGLGQYLSGDAVCIAYSWPAWKSAVAYSRQVNYARSSVRNLRELIRFLADETDAERIHLLAYSNGAQMLTDALVQLRLAEADAGPEELRRLRIGYVIYAAADEDLMHFRGACLDGIEDLALGTVVYSSRADLGLWLSKVTVSGSERLGRARTVHPSGGDAPPGATAVIDASRPLARWNGDGLYDHSYWYSNPWVSSDIILMLRHDLSPTRRGLVPGPSPQAWYFPADYPERAPAIARDALWSTVRAER